MVTSAMGEVVELGALRNPAEVVSVTGGLDAVSKRTPPAACASATLAVGLAPTLSPPLVRRFSGAESSMVSRGSSDRRS